MGSASPGLALMWDHGGLQAGILFMKLDAMRKYGFEKQIIDAADKYGNEVDFAEQDLLNIIFHKKKSKL